MPVENRGQLVARARPSHPSPLENSRPRRSNSSDCSPRCCSSRRSEAVGNEADFFGAEPDLRGRRMGWNAAELSDSGSIVTCRSHVRSRSAEYWHNTPTMNRPSCFSTSAWGGWQLASAALECPTQDLCAFAPPWSSRALTHAPFRRVPHRRLRRARTRAAIPAKIERVVSGSGISVGSNKPESVV